VLNISMEDPVAISDLTPKSFEHPPSALQLAVCERSQGDLVKKVPPHYPEDARFNYIQG